MTNPESPTQTASLPVEPSIQAEASHKMGILALQAKQPAAALSHFMAALEAEPSRGQYWLSYIDALLQTGQPEAAREILTIARRQGLEGSETDALAKRIESSGQPKTGSARHGKSSGKAAKQHGKKFRQQDDDTLAALFNQGRFAEAASLARTMTVHAPAHAFAWKILGMALKQMGQNADALPAMQKTVELSPGDADAHINLGATLQDMGRLNEAEASHRRGLAINPGNAQGYSNLGTTLQSLGRMEEAEANFRRALQINPGYAKALYNLGSILYRMNRLDEAETNLRIALKINPDYARAHCNLGITLHAQGRLGEAEASYQRALQIDPDHAEAHYNLGSLQEETGRLNEAEASYRRALQINPDYAEAYSNLGATLQKLSRPDEALACFRQQLRLTPESAVLQHQIASLSGNNTEHAPARYVENVFDSYAKKFDAHLLQELKYIAPRELMALIMQHSTPPAEKWDVLDLGCGTGLAGAEIAPFARQLTGVDLSAKMLEKASARNLYHRLERMDLLTMMRGEPAAGFDVIIAADVFVYIGKVDEIVRETKRLLRPGGLFAFSIETLEEAHEAEDKPDAQQDYHLEITGRYTHAPGYVTRLAASNGFTVLNMTATAIRTEQGKPVHGRLILLKS